MIKKIKENEVEYKSTEINYSIKQKNQLEEKTNEIMPINRGFKSEDKNKENIPTEKFDVSIKNIKSKYILKNIFNKVNKEKILRIIKYNKKLKND